MDSLLELRAKGNDLQRFSHQKRAIGTHVDVAVVGYDFYHQSVRPPAPVRRNRRRSSMRGWRLARRE